MDIQFDSICVNQIHANSGVFVGPNTQSNWSSQNKENFALGVIVGDGNLICHNINVVHDDDLVDMPIKNITNQEEEGKTNGGNHSED